MAYATSTGTYNQMISAMATFALANGWVAPAAPGVRNYWRVVLASGTVRTGSSDVRIASLDFKDVGGVSVGAPSTLLASSSDAGISFSGWLSGTTTGNEWLGGYWATAVDVQQVTIDFTGAEANEKLAGSFSLEYSDDGILWTAYTSFDTQGSIGWAGPATFIFDPLTWPLSPDGEVYYGHGSVQGVEDDNTDVRHYQIGGANFIIYPLWAWWSMGTTLLHGSNKEEQGFLHALPPDGLVAEWHFFTDTTVSNYLHVSFRMTYEGEPIWSHWFMGEIDKRGMSHNGMCYLARDGMEFIGMGFAATSTTGTGNGLNRTLPFGETQGVVSGGFDPTTYFYLQNGANYAVPDDGAWPPRNVTNRAGGKLYPTLRTNAFTSTQNQLIANYLSPAWLGSVGFLSEVHPVSGQITLGTIPAGVIAGAADDDLVCLMGEYPGIRSCRVDNLSDGGEVTVGADTWKTFPRLQKGDLSDLDILYNVTSGPAGWAHKKVI